MGMLADKVAVVAGVGPGLGRSVALALAGQGAAVVMGARRPDVMDEVAAQVRANGGQALTQLIDLAEPDQVQALAAAAREQFSRIDILVNNAFDTGAEYTTVAEADLSRWQESMRVTYWGTVAMTQAVIPQMTEQGDGRIIMIGSLAVHRPQPTWGSYIGPKAALAGLIRLLATEVGPAGIRVNGVQPAHIFGPTVEQFFHDTARARGVDYEHIYREAAGETSLGYLPNADEVAGSVVFFASPLSAPVTGQILNVNAGAWMS
jgi:NAD(P)-dependent dehydrogenase (short-subunit alcohol dehydrogenase family)